MDKVNAKIFKHGNSQAITLNKKALYQAGFDIGDQLTGYMEDGKLIFEKKEMDSFKETIQNFYRNGGGYQETEIFEDEPQGEEVW